LNADGATNGYGGGNNTHITQSYVPGWSAFTVNTRTSTPATSFDKNLFPVMPSGNVGINTTSPNCNLSVNGIANIHNGSPYAVSHGYMAAGSLTIGDTTSDYGDDNGWTSSTAGLLMECSDYTEIAIHDNGTRVASIAQYSGLLI